MSVPGQVALAAAAAFPHAKVQRCETLEGGKYNQVFDLTLDVGTRVVLRIAPLLSQQTNHQRQLMRNELAATELLTPIAGLMPKILFSDFSGQIIESDYIFYDYLPGVTAGQGLQKFADPLPFWRDLGKILASIHSVKGSKFGAIQGPHFSQWHEALKYNFELMQIDLADLDLPFNDLRTAAMFLSRTAESVNAGATPSLLHGDLWLGNVLIDPAASEPTITGVLDSDRVTWGDPAADWTFAMLRKRSKAEKTAFFEGYGQHPDTDRAAVDPQGAALREAFYRIAALGETRLELARLGNDEKVEATYPRLERELEKLIQAS